MTMWLRSVVALGAILFGVLAPEAQVFTEDAPPLPALDRAKVQALIDAADASARVKTLLKERYEAARTEQEGRWKEYFAGRGDFDWLLASSQRLLEAERDVCVVKADRVAAIQAHWQRLDAIHKLNRARFEQGRLGGKEVMRSLFDRTGAEMALDREGAWPGPPSEAPADHLRTHDQPEMPSAPAEAVRTLLARVDSDRRRAFLSLRIEAAFNELGPRWVNCLAGRCTLVVLLEASERLLEAELDLSDRPADRVTFLDAQRRRMDAAEKMVKERFDMGRYPEQDLRETQYARLTAEIRLERAKSGDIDRLKRLFKTRAEAAEAEVGLRLKEYLGGRSTMYILLAANKHWLQAMQDMDQEPALRVAALEAYRGRLAEIEKVNQLRYEAQRIAIQDVAAVRYYRAEADLWLERATPAR